MCAKSLTFRRLIAPIDGDAFLRNHYRREALYISGPEDKLSGLFSWEDLNAILAMSTIWSDTTLELAIDGKRIPTRAYCYEGTTRDNERGQIPDYHQVHKHLERGATLALNQIARLTPGLREVVQSLEAVFGAAAHAVAFCSFNSVAGYFSHFDTTNAFACHIAGSKIWRVYEGRHENASGHTHLVENGFEAAVYFAGVQEQEIKDELKRRVEHAVAKGVFGAPTFFVGDKMWFGQDRLDWVEAELGGSN